MLHSLLYMLQILKILTYWDICNIQLNNFFNLVIRPSLTATNIYFRITWWTTNRMTTWWIEIAPKNRTLSENVPPAIFCSKKCPAMTFLHQILTLGDEMECCRCIKNNHVVIRFSVQLMMSDSSLHDEMDITCIMEWQFSPFWVE